MHYIMIKESIHQKAIIILNVHLTQSLKIQKAKANNYKEKRLKKYTIILYLKA